MAIRDEGLHSYDRSAVGEEQLVDGRLFGEVNRHHDPKELTPQEYHHALNQWGSHFDTCWIVGSPLPGLNGSVNNYHSQYVVELRTVKEHPSGERTYCLQLDELTDEDKGGTSYVVQSWTEYVRTEDINTLLKELLVGLAELSEAEDG